VIGGGTCRGENLKENDGGGGGGGPGGRKKNKCSSQGVTQKKKKKKGRGKHCSELNFRIGKVYHKKWKEMPGNGGG